MTKEQRALANQEIDQAKEVLSRHGYYVANLYEAVTNHYECTKEEAMMVLDTVLLGAYICEKTNSEIDVVSREMGLKEKEDESSDN